MKKLLLSFVLISTLISTSNAQDHCERRTFVANVSLDMAGFFVLTYQDDLLDSLYWDFGDGQTQWQTSNVGTGSANHTYSNPGTYNVTLERWGVTGVPSNITPLHCTYTIPVTIHPTFTDSICGSDFLTFIDGDTVTFSNQSVIQSPSFSTHPQHELWDFGNGFNGLYLNRIYPVIYAPGTYTACLYYMGFSYNNGGYFYNCESCTTFTIGSTGINESESFSFKIYPNPSSQFLKVSSSAEINEIEVSDMLGKRKEIISSGQSGLEIDLNIQSLSEGVYILKLKSDRGEVVRKFVKKY